MKLQFLDVQRGNKLLCYNDFLFTKLKEAGRNIKSRFRDRNRKGFLFVEDNLRILGFKEHSHPDHPELVEKIRFKNTLLQRSRSTTETASSK